MQALVLADIDDLHWLHGSGQVDLILSLGDIADSLLLEAWEAFDAPPVLAVKGNHDPLTLFPEGITDLHLRTISLGDYRFGGFNGSWKYKPRGHFLYEQDEATGLLQDFPAVDIFVSHNSPRHVNDKEDETHYGFEALNSYIDRHRPRFLLHGHQHVNKETQVGATTVIGVYGHRMLEIDLTSVGIVDNSSMKTILADITTLEVDAIVNAANTRLLGGGGVDGAIHSAAGPELLQECRLLGGCDTGDAKITKGYELPSRFVIHTVGPVWHGGHKDEAKLLSSCYRRSLELAAENGVKTIAFPSISTGVFGYPISEAAQIAVQTVQEVLAQLNNGIEVTFCCFSKNDFDVYEALL